MPLMSRNACNALETGDFGENGDFGKNRQRAGDNGEKRPGPSGDW